MAAQLEFQLKEYLMKTLAETDGPSVKKHGSEYRFPIKPNALVSMLKQGPKTQNGSRHE